jgi:head-tail adaptor
MKGPTLGAMNHRVVIQEPVELQPEGGNGQPTRTWKNVTIAAAQIQGLGGIENNFQGSTAGIGRYALFIHFHTRLFAAGPKWRLKWCAPGGDRILNIESCQPHEGRNRFLLLICKEDADRVET